MREHNLSKSYSTAIYQNRSHVRVIPKDNSQFVIIGVSLAVNSDHRIDYQHRTTLHLPSIINDHWCILTFQCSPQYSCSFIFNSWAVLHMLVTDPRLRTCTQYQTRVPPTPTWATTGSAGSPSSCRRPTSETFSYNIFTFQKTAFSNSK